MLQQTPPCEPTGFASLGLDQIMLEALAARGYLQPTPVQTQAIPVVLEGRDVIAQAGTGTGKTAAFALPLLQRLGQEKAGGTRGRAPGALVLAPTRELAQQVADAARAYGQSYRLKVAAIYGGQSFGDQVRELSRGVDFVVATPGRALDHIRRGTIDLKHVGTVVLDEADEMLDMGFAEDIGEVLSALPSPRQTLLFSATMPGRIIQLAKKHQSQPVQLRVAPERLEQGEAPRVREAAYLASRGQTVPALRRILESESPVSTLIFCRTRTDVDDLSEALASFGLAAEPLHGGMSQAQRERTLRRLKENKSKVIIATDVAARGLDIDQLTHVINIGIPASSEVYVHRVGRVGRAGRAGVAITLVEPRSRRLINELEKATRRTIALAKVPTAAELQNQRLVATGAAVAAVVNDKDLESYRAVVQRLLDDGLDPLAVAAAAMKVAHIGLHPHGQDLGEDIVVPPPKPVRAWRSDEPQSAAPRRAPRQGGQYSAPERGAHGNAPRHQDGGGRDRFPNKRSTPGDHGKHAANDGDQTCLKISVGRSAGVRPGDLVGAITGEVGIPGRAIGAISIRDNHSLVEVPRHLAAQISQALMHSRIKGQKVTAGEA